MKNIIAVLILLLLAFTPCAFAKSENELDILPLMTSKTTQENRLWVGTFQLVWNDFMDGIIKQPIKFSGSTPTVVKELNKQTFTANDLSENSYYKTYGKTSENLKLQIAQAILEKFNETSDVLDMVNWAEGDGKYTVYAMLKKDFKFLTAFDKLEPSKFANSSEKVNYFGIKHNSNPILDDMVHVLFYNSDNDFAVAIMTDGDDILYLYRTGDNKTFDKLYADMKLKNSKFSGNKEFSSKDELKIPDINLYKIKAFEKLCGRRIKGTNIKIDEALETVDFKMNNEGIQLKSEAIIMTKTTALHPEVTKPRKFFFDDTFVLFLQEKEQPYFALRVHDIDLINKTGR
jgi:hypothetical protein